MLAELIVLDCDETTFETKRLIFWQLNSIIMGLIGLHSLFEIGVSLENCSTGKPLQEDTTARDSSSEPDRQAT